MIGPMLFRGKVNQVVGISIRMSASKSSTNPHFGFLSVADLGGTVLIGGYLVLNALGRPVEFHCTEPVRPNRAQQILYGEMLQPYLYGEQIGQTLVGNTQLEVQCVFTDQASVLCLRDFLQIPVILVSSESQPHLLPFRLGINDVAVRTRDEQDQERVIDAYRETLPDWNLHEPFQRIHEAVNELQKAA
jgi:hypothetical protein